jgi:type I restriction enzyme M protein
MSLSNTVKAIQGIMRKDAGVDGDAQRIGQLGWMLCLKIYSDLELETELEDTKYKSPIPKKFRWESWADESIAGKDSLTGDALINFINNELFPKLKELDLSSFTGQARERGALLISVFDDAYNYMKNGTLLRQVVNKINQDIDYNSVETRHLFGDIYEQILKDLQNAGNAGEYYTPRAVTQFAIEMVNPQLGEIVLDPACGTGGFLTGAFEHMKKQVKKPAELKALKNSIRGVEKKPLPHVLCATNMMVHGIEVPSNIINDNTLAKPLRDYGKSDQVDIIITNPPFGGVEEDGIENNFPAEFRTKETADLFLVLVIELLKDGGRAAIILPDSTLFGEGVKTKIKRKILEECNLHTIVRLPKSVFAPYTNIATNILFLTKGEPTKDTWYFEHQVPLGVKAYSKTKPMRLAEFDVEREWWSNRSESEQSWKVSAAEIMENNFNLDIKNPNAIVALDDDPDQLLRENVEVLEIVSSLKLQLKSELMAKIFDKNLKSNLDSYIDHLLVAPRGIDRLRELILGFAFSGALSPNDPQGSWNSEMTLKDLGKMIRGITYSKSESRKEPHDDLVPLLGAANIQREINFSDLTYVPNKLIKTDQLLLDGDILICMSSGSKHLVGKAAMVRNPINASFGAFCGVYRPTNLVDRDYLALFFQSQKYRKQISGSSRGIGINNLRISDIESIHFPFPPVEQQELVVRVASDLLALCNQIDEKSINQDELASRFAFSVVAKLA